VPTAPHWIVPQASGQIIGNNDLWLAAHVRAEGWILVTNNEREF